VQEFYWITRRRNRDAVVAGLTLPSRDQHGLTVLLDPPTLLRSPPLLPDEE